MSLLKYGLCFQAVILIQLVVLQLVPAVVVADVAVRRIGLRKYIARLYWHLDAQWCNPPKQPLPRWFVRILQQHRKSVDEWSLQAFILQHFRV